MECYILDFQVVKTKKLTKVFIEQQPYQDKHKIEKKNGMDNR